jgi:hypothetical protein
MTCLTSHCLYCFLGIIKIGIVNVCIFCVKNTGLEFFSLHTAARVATKSQGDNQI